MVNVGEPVNHPVQPLFRAYTLEADSLAMMPSIVHRPRLEEFLRQQPWRGRSIIVSGPAGCGKTMVALQAAIGQAGRIQYVCARGIPQAMAFQASPPLQEGEWGASLMNGLVQAQGDPMAPSLREWTEQLRDHGISDDPTLVIDDLDLLPENVPDELRALAARFAGRLSEATVILLTRKSFLDIGEFFGIRDRVRVISPEMLAIRQEELPALIASGCFGEASADAIAKAHAETGGLPGFSIWSIAPRCSMRHWTTTC